MIEIVKRGTRREIDCKRCGSILSFTDEDIINESYHDIRFIVCPVCQHEIPLRRKRHRKKRGTVEDDER